VRKHWLYASYLIRHKFWVFITGVGCRASLWRLIVHDWSKLMPCEWFPYARQFYGPKDQRIKAEFDRAWLHHQHKSPHHWQHYILHEDSGNVKVLEMPDTFVREMVADWMGAGRAITGKWEVWLWYEKNKGNIMLAPQTRERVEYLIAMHKNDHDSIGRNSA
jgi:hypothetical protein